MKYVPFWIFKSYWFQMFLAKVYFRYYCPGGDGLVRDCIASGKCGCDNDRRG